MSIKTERDCGFFFYGYWDLMGQGRFWTFFLVTLKHDRKFIILGSFSHEIFLHQKMKNTKHEKLKKKTNHQESNLIFKSIKSAKEVEKFKAWRIYKTSKAYSNHSLSTEFLVSKMSPTFSNPLILPSLLFFKFR